MNPLKPRVSHTDCPAEAALGHSSWGLRAARGKAGAGVALSTPWGPGGRGLAAEAAPASGCWDGAEVRWEPEGTQLTEPRCVRLAPPPTTRAAPAKRSQPSALPSSYRSPLGRKGASRARSARSAPANSSPPAPASAPSTGVSWSARRFSLCASSQQVLSADLKEGPGSVWPPRTSLGPHLKLGDGEVSRGLRDPDRCEPPGLRAGVCALRFGSLERCGSKG